MNSKSGTTLVRSLAIALVVGTASIALAQESGKQLSGGTKTVPAQPTPAAGASAGSSSIKTLDKDDIADYTDGKAMRYARVAELNGFPGPRKALEWADDLKLTADQKTALEKALRDEKESASAIGKQFVEKERELDSLFKGNTAPDAAKVSALTAEIGKLDGEYRAAHLKAHIETGKALTPEQLANYRKAKADSDKEKKDGEKKDGDKKDGDKKPKEAKKKAPAAKP